MKFACRPHRFIGVQVRRLFCFWINIILTHHPSKGSGSGTCCASGAQYVVVYSCGIAVEGPGPTIISCFSSSGAIFVAFAILVVLLLRCQDTISTSGVSSHLCGRVEKRLDLRKSENRSLQPVRSLKDEVGNGKLGCSTYINKASISPITIPTCKSILDDRRC